MDSQVDLARACGSGHINTAAKALSLGQGQIKQDQTLLWTCVAGAHLQCVNNQYAKFKRNEICLNCRLHTNKQCRLSKGGVNIIMSKLYYQMCTYYRVRTCSMCEQSKCIKFEYEGMKTAGVTDYTNQTPLSISDG